MLETPSLLALIATLATCVSIGHLYDDECRGAEEYCVSVSFCPSKMGEIQSGYRPQICGFSGKTPMVCCDEAHRTPYISKRPTSVENTRFGPPMTAGQPDPSNRPIFNQNGYPYTAGNNHDTPWSDTNRDYPLYTTPSRDTGVHYYESGGPYTSPSTNRNDHHSYGSGILFTTAAPSRDTRPLYQSSNPVEDQPFDSEDRQEWIHKNDLYDEPGLFISRPVSQTTGHRGTKPFTSYVHASSEAQYNKPLTSSASSQSGYDKPQTSYVHFSNSDEYRKPLTSSVSDPNGYSKGQVSSVWQNEVTRRPPAKVHKTRPTQGPLTKRDQFDGSFMRISEKKCREYSTHVTESFAAIPLVPDPEPLFISVPKCDYDGVPLIVGGEKASLGEFPHMAAIGYRRRDSTYSFACGGSLISERFVLSAAHCASSDRDNDLISPIPEIVRLGDLNLVRDDDGADPIDVNILRIIKHPGYKPPVKYHDIALIELDEEIEFSVNLRPACLWTKPSIESSNAVATGWGQIDFAESTSDDLLKVVVDIIDVNKCRQLYRKTIGRRLPQGITDDQLCAGSLEGGRDTCGGDSGGPLQVTIESNQCLFNIIAVTSLGKSSCGKINGPGIYTGVGPHIGWIESVVWNATVSSGAGAGGTCAVGTCVPVLECSSGDRLVDNLASCSTASEKYTCCAITRSLPETVGARADNKVDFGNNTINSDDDIAQLNADDKEPELDKKTPPKAITDGANNFSHQNPPEDINVETNGDSNNENDKNVNKSQVPLATASPPVKAKSGAKMASPTTHYKIANSLFLIIILILI